MTFHAVSHATQIRAPHPLGRLILLRFADGCDGSDDIIPSNYTDFCCASRDEIIAAVADLVASGCLMKLGPNWYSLVGYRPLVEARQSASAYVKKKIPRHIQTTVWERDGFACKTCGVQRQLSVDHIIPERKGGTLALDNLQTLCRPCNSRKKDRLP